MYFIYLKTPPKRIDYFHHPMMQYIYIYIYIYYIFLFLGGGGGLYIKTMQCKLCNNPLLDISGKHNLDQDSPSTLSIFKGLDLGARAMNGRKKKVVCQSRATIACLKYSWLSVRQQLGNLLDFAS